MAEVPRRIGYFPFIGMAIDSERLEETLTWDYELSRREKLKEFQKEVLDFNSYCLE
jgi:hypothetical protein